MNGKSETFAIFESYKQILKEQDETMRPAYIVMDIIENLIRKDQIKSITGQELTKVIQFLNDEKTLASYDNFQVSPMKMQSSSAEGDASAVNMGRGGVLEVQPDGQYPQ
jgi:hypothetical protein